MVLNNPLFVARNSRSSSFQIEQSLRFNDDDTAHFDRTPSSVGARQTWTYSVWVKGSDFSGDANTLLSGGNYSYGTYLWFRDGGHISLGRYYSGSYTFLVEADGFYRDPTAWYHIVVVFDSGQATASNRVKMYVNGEQITSFTTASYPSQHFETDINNDGIQWIGERGSNSDLKLHGYLAEAHLVDGSPLEPTSFGEYDENGVWRPIEVNLTGPNNGTTWSDYLTDSNGAFESSYPATKAFNGTTDAANTARATIKNTTTTFEPPTDIPYTSSVEVWTYYAGSVSLNGGSSVSVSNDQFWRTIATGSGSLDTLTFTSSNSFVYLGAIRVDGVILIDGNTHQYGKNGFYLKFDPDATNGIGHDHSGNGNNWTPNNFSTTAGSGYDVMSDTPTNNFATLNPIEPASASAGTLSDGNLYIANQDYSLHKATFHFGGGGPTTGKYYWEVTHTGGNYTSYIGVTNNLAEDAGEIAAGADKSWFGNNTSRKYDNTTQSYTGSYSSGDIHGYAIDLDAQEFKYYINGTLKITDSTLPDPATNVLVPFQFTTNSGSGYSWSNTSWNFGQQAFSHQPAGYKSLCTSNLPAPDIADGSQYFNTITYSGNGSQPRSLTGVGFQPSWLWIKRRDASNLHNVTDEVRGASTGALATDSTLAEFSSQIGSFDSDGFTTNSNAGQAVNGSGSTYVAWSWLASNTSGSSNTDGTITSTVSANQTAGFSIVSYTGDGSSSATVGHGLGATPAMIITKARAGTNADNSWYSWHKGLSSGYNIRLDSTGTELNTSSATSGVIAAPTNTTTFGFTAGSNVINVNENSTTYIAYCFAEIEGYSKFGRYTANGSSDGPFVYCGFRPALILFKNTDATEAWSIFDSTRNDYNGPDAKMLLPSSSAAEATSSNRDIDFLSNGFKIRVSALNPNTASGNVYIFAAFAENPFGGRGVSPATAR